jgi:uncharacterized membrane protein
MDASEVPPSGNATRPAGAPGSPPIPDAVWSFRGYHLEGSNFATALIHLYRAEVTRANSWRSRLDVTTNWAVVSTAAAISFAFAQPNTHHSVIILITILVTLFLFIEARRYRYYELWSYRIRIIEIDFFAAMLIPPFKPRVDWSQNLAQSLVNPQFPISIWEAFGRRLRHTYMWVYLVLGIAWLAKLLLYPEGITSLEELLQRSSMGALKGWAVLLLHFIFYTVLIAIGLWTRQMQKATGEVLHRRAGAIRDLTSDIDQEERAEPVEEP